MKEPFTIIPECCADTNLVETITNSFDCFNHQKNCNKVASTMQSPNLIDSFAVGIIDKDKKEIYYIREFDLISSSADLYLFKHKTKHHYIIQISPAIEKFILKSAKEADINLELFGLPSDLDGLKRITKRKTSSNNQQLRKLFFELRRKNVSEIVLLSKWILYLKENKYNAIIEEIKNL